MHVPTTLGKILLHARSTSQLLPLVTEDYYSFLIVEQHRGKSLFITLDTIFSKGCFLSRKTYTVRDIYLFSEDSMLLENLVREPRKMKHLIEIRFRHNLILLYYLE